MGQLYKIPIPSNPFGDPQKLDIRFLPPQLEDKFAKTLEEYLSAQTHIIVRGISGGGKTVIMNVTHQQCQLTKVISRVLSST